MMFGSGQEGLWSDPSYWSEPAEQAFSKARRRAVRQALMDRLGRRNSSLLSFDEVSSSLVPESTYHVQTIPLDRIVGSVGKADYFTRTFLPKDASLLRRWKRVYALVHGLRGYEPIELYEVDGRYYVVDGHFRLSVGRSMGINSIQARVRRWS